MLLLFLNPCLLHFWIMPILFFQVFTFLFACVYMFPQGLLGRNWLWGVCHRSSNSPAGTWAHQGHTRGTLAVCVGGSGRPGSAQIWRAPGFVTNPSYIYNCHHQSSTSSALFAIYKNKWTWILSVRITKCKLVNWRDGEPQKGTNRLDTISLLRVRAGREMR